MCLLSFNLFLLSSRLPSDRWVLHYSQEYVRSISKHETRKKRLQLLHIVFSYETRLPSIDCATEEGSSFFFRFASGGKASQWYDNKKRLLASLVEVFDAARKYRSQISVKEMGRDRIWKRISDKMKTWDEMMWEASDEMWGGTVS